MNTSVATVIGLSELSFVATQINSLVLTQPLEIYGILALSYFVLCFGLSRVAYALEARGAPQR